MNSKIKALVYSVITAGALSSACAGQINASAFDPAKSSVVSFATLPWSFGRPGPVIADGITFTDGSGSFRTYPAAAPFAGGPAVQICAERGCIMTDTELDFIAVALPSPVSLVGAYIGSPNAATTATAEFYSGSTLLGSVNISAQPFEGVFAGWNAGGASITSVKFIDTANQGFAIALTGFMYQGASPVPEPSTAIQLSLGILMAALALRTAKTRRL